MRHKFRARCMDSDDCTNIELCDNCELIDLETGRTANIGGMYIEEIHGDEALTLALILNGLWRKQGDDMERRYEERIARSGQ